MIRGTTTFHTYKLLLIGVVHTNGIQAIMIKQGIECAVFIVVHWQT